MDIEKTDLIFNTLEYTKAFEGTFQIAKSISSAIQIRKIAGTEYFDGVLPWPYVTFREGGEALLKNEYNDLITITGVIAPSGLRPSSTANDHELVPFKNHFIFDPSLGSIKLSKKSASNLRKGSKIWQAVDANTGEGWKTFVHLYRKFVLEKKLTDGFFDFKPEHFFCLSRIKGIQMFGVRSSTGWGAMACGALSGRELHLIHNQTSEQGRQSFASYVLMETITRYCEYKGLILFIGGLPNGADEHLLRFKKRWTNKTLSAWLLKIVIRPDIYEKLAMSGNTFFPGYRFG